MSLVILLVFFGVALLGVPLAFSLGLSAIAGLLVSDVDLNLLPSRMMSAVNAFPLMSIPFFILEFRRSRRRDAFLRSLPDNLQLMAGSLRAGYGVLQAIDTVAHEAGPPTAEEFQRVLTEARLGMPVEEALEAMAERIDNADFRWVVLAINIQREVGGNLAEVLTTVGETMRARNRLKGEIRALTAEGRISAIVLASLPFAMALFLWTTNPGYLTPLIEETFGLIAIGVGVLLMAAGAFWLKKIVDIEI